MQGGFTQSVASIKSLISDWIIFETSKKRSKNEEVDYSKSHNFCVKNLGITVYGGDLPTTPSPIESEISIMGAGADLGFSRGDGFSKKLQKFCRPFLLGRPNWFFDLSQSNKKTLFWPPKFVPEAKFWKNRPEKAFLGVFETFWPKNAFFLRAPTHFFEGWKVKAELRIRFQKKNLH